MAAARGLPVERVRALIDRLTERSGAIIGAPPRVNVLRLNLALDEEKPEPASASAGTESRSDAAPKSPGEAPAASDSGATAPAPAAEARLAHPDMASDVAAIRSQVGDVSDRLQQLLDRLGIYTEAIAHDKAGHDKTQAELKGLEDRVAKLAEDSRHVPQLVEHVSTLDERVKSAEETLRCAPGPFQGGPRRSQGDRDESRSQSGVRPHGPTSPRLNPVTFGPSRRDDPSRRGFW